MFSYHTSNEITIMNKNHLLFNFNNHKINIYYDTNYVYCKSDSINLDYINVLLSVKSKVNFEDIQTLIKENTNTSSSIENVNFTDYMNLFDSKSNTSKYIHIKENLQKYNETININKELLLQIPKGLIMNKNQRFNLIYQEIERLNNNMDTLFYIVCNDNNPYNLSIRLKYDGDLNEKLKLNNIEYFELNFILDHNLYPFVPPKVSYVKPNIDMDLIMNILNLDIWTTSNWNYTISLDKLVTTLGNELEKHFLEYYNSNLNNNELYDLIIQMSQYINDIPFYKININLDFAKILTIVSQELKSKYWNSGIGYGTCDNSTKWDINQYINDRDTKNSKLVSLLTLIADKIKNTDECSIISASILYSYIFKQLNGCNILELNKNKELYNQIINIIINLEGKNVPNLIYENIYVNIHDICEDIIMLQTTTKDIITEDLSILYIKFISFYEILKLKINIQNNNNFIPSDDKVQNYLQMIEQNNFLNYTITPRNMFYAYKDKSLDKKTIMRVVSEISSLKKNLPVNWDTSIIFRTCKTNLNFVSFIISGPMDTPYENGLFEFHAYFPDSYPNVCPKVLLKTTGDGTVRFNPNLYNNGKVCLSLLGTWGGEQCEKWNSQLSTFLQVLISIQSLILVEQPYFNEPGWECEMHTEKGNKASFEYNDELRFQTIRIAMINMIKNPPESYETYIKEHFIHKKVEIFNTIEKWISESNIYKNKMIEQYEEIKKLL